MAAQVEIQVRLVNPDAVAAFREARELIAEATEDLPWRDDLREAGEKLTEAAAGLQVERSGGDGDAEVDDE